MIMIIILIIIIIIITPPPLCMGALSVDSCRLSFRLYVFPVSDPKSRMEAWKGIGSHKRSKVSKPINAETENAPYLPKGRPTNFKVANYTDGLR